LPIATIVAHDLCAQRSQQPSSQQRTQQRRISFAGAACPARSERRHQRSSAVRCPEPQKQPQLQPRPQCQQQPARRRRGRRQRGSRGCQQQILSDVCIEEIRLELARQATAEDANGSAGGMVGGMPGMADGGTAGASLDGGTADGIMSSSDMADGSLDGAGEFDSLLRGNDDAEQTWSDDLVISLQAEAAAAGAEAACAEAARAEAARGEMRTVTRAEAARVAAAEAARDEAVHAEVATAGQFSPGGTALDAYEPLTVGARVRARHESGQRCA